MRSLRFASVLLTTAVVACGGTSEIDDPAMESAGQSVGQESAAMGELPAESSEGEVTTQVQAIGSGLQSLATQHQAYAAVNSSAPLVDGSLMAQEGSSVSWDGTNLEFSWSTSETGFDYVYAVSMTFEDDGDNQIINGTYDLDFDISGFSYEVSAQYDGLTIDGQGCAIAGTVTVAYDYSIAGVALPGVGGATNSSGRVVVAYNGCDDVTISGT